ncbi:MAG TPA: hypothetical protein VGL28_07185 [Steroidobacteraceae bacterium]|jgi:hypothetical protein
MDQPRQPSSNAPADTEQRTPGRPKESGSRQQTTPDQTSNSGSPDLDKLITEGTGPDAVPTKPAGAK